MSNSNYFFSPDQQALLGDTPKFFYGLRRNADGELYLYKLNQLSNDDVVEINLPGDNSENYTDFETGVDYIEGRSSTTHELIDENIKYEQYRWDNRSLYYYIDSEGQLIMRIGQKYVYPEGI